MSIMNHEPLVVALRCITHDPIPTPLIITDITQPQPHSAPLECYIICARPLVIVTVLHQVQ